MASRHLARSVAMQSLFEWDFGGCNNEALPEILSHNIKEFAPGLSDTSFIANLVAGVVEKREALDRIVEKAAKDWPITQTPLVDRNVLRIGLYELLFAAREEVPARVAINEAIELAKTFGGEKSSKFVNGVLGTVYKEMGEPGKYDEPKKKRHNKVLTVEERAALPLERLGGAVVYGRGDKGSLYLAFVHDIFGYWTLSKGHLGQSEDESIGTMREIKEELSLNVDIKIPLGSNEYIASHPEHGKVRKQVTYFLACAPKMDELVLTPSGGLDDARWFAVKEVFNLKIYDDILPIIKKGIEWLNNNPGK